jgi:hypothetical protein
VAILQFAAKLDVKYVNVSIQGHMVLNKAVIADYLEHYPPVGPQDKVQLKNVK